MIIEKEKELKKVKKEVEKEKCDNTEEDEKKQQQKKETIGNIVSNCHCCGTIVVYPTFATKFRCGICNTTNAIWKKKSKDKKIEIPHFISYDYVKKLIEMCIKKHKEEKVKNSSHIIFNPLSDYLLEAFRSYECLNNSFKIKRLSKRLHYSTSNINFEEIRNIFNLLATLPTRRPLFNALCGASKLLKRITIFSNEDDDPRKFLWILILLEIPFLSKSLFDENLKKESNIDVPEINELCYDILKRCIGILAYSNNIKSSNYIASWFSKLSAKKLIEKVDLINLYITFHLRKYFYKNNNLKNLKKLSYLSLYNNEKKKERQKQLHKNGRNSESNRNDFNSKRNTLNCDRNSFSTTYQRAYNFSLLNKKKKNSSGVSIKPSQYYNDWHIRTASMVLSYFVKANNIRDDPIPLHTFYNSLIDFVDVKNDFDLWQICKQKEILNKSQDSKEKDTQLVINYIQNSLINEPNNYSLFYFCLYPFLISLGAKILILEYEIRRQMERKAEEAFITSINKRLSIDMYFKVRVRREYIVQDSLQCIKTNQNNLKKTLRVQFINEPGVDAGGLKKEWFTLLTKSLFSPETGMLYNVEDTNFLWFNIKPIENEEMYFLFGVVLGLAIYNSSILELKFPLAFYRIILGEKIGQRDYNELFPVSYSNLIKLKHYTNEQILDLDLTFEVFYKDIFDSVHNFELISNGSKVKVTKSNLEFFIEKYCNFFIYDGIKNQIDSFIKGFTTVIGGNALSLFQPEEINLLVCGSEEDTLDFNILKSITKYNGWASKEEAENSQIVKWFWEYINCLNSIQSKKFLTFVTGSDRVPATGIQNSNFIITFVNNAKDSNRLPISHTCFNELILYSYNSKEKIFEKLDKAFNECGGFGIK